MVKSIAQTGSTNRGNRFTWKNLKLMASVFVVLAMLGLFLFQVKPVPAQEQPRQVTEETVIGTSEPQGSDNTADYVSAQPSAGNGTGDSPTTTSGKDRDIGNLVEDVIDKMGKDGVVTVEESRGLRYEPEMEEIDVNLYIMSHGILPKGIWFEPEALPVKDPPGNAAPEAATIGTASNADRSGGLSLSTWGCKWTCLPYPWNFPCVPVCLKLCLWCLEGNAGASGTNHNALSPGDPPQGMPEPFTPSSDLNPGVDDDCMYGHDGCVTGKATGLPTGMGTTAAGAPVNSGIAYSVKMGCETRGHFSYHDDCLFCYMENSPGGTGTLMDEHIFESFGEFLVKHGWAPTYVFIVLPQPDMSLVVPMEPERDFSVRSNDSIHSHRVKGEFEWSIIIVPSVGGSQAVDDAREALKKGIDVLAEAVKVTLGPRGQSVALDKKFGPSIIVEENNVVTGESERGSNSHNGGASTPDAPVPVKEPPEQATASAVEPQNNADKSSGTAGGTADHGKAQGTSR